MAIGIFGYHYAMDREFDYEDSLAALAILGYVSNSVFLQFYMAVTMFSNFRAILKRVGEVIDMDEYDQESYSELIAQGEGEEQRISFEDASLTWGFSIKKELENSEKEENIQDVNLKEINFKASSNQLTAVVGSVGWGKSTFLAAIMKELQLLEGTVSISFKLLLLLRHL